MHCIVSNCDSFFSHHILYVKLTSVCFHIIAAIFGENHDTLLYKSLGQVR